MYSKLVQLYIHICIHVLFQILHMTFKFELHQISAVTDFFVTMSSSLRIWFGRLCSCHIYVLKKCLNFFAWVCKFI